MTEEQLRALVREIVASHVGRPDSVPTPPAARTVEVRMHASHARFALPVDADGRCLVESHVTCNHCGYCQSYGH